MKKFLKDNIDEISTRFIRIVLGLGLGLPAILLIISTANLFNDSTEKPDLTKTNIFSDDGQNVPLFTYPGNWKESTDPSDLDEDTAEISSPSFNCIFTYVSASAVDADVYFTERVQYLKSKYFSKVVSETDHWGKYKGKGIKVDHTYFYWVFGFVRYRTEVFLAEVDLEKNDPKVIIEIICPKSEYQNSKKGFELIERTFKR